MSCTEAGGSSIVVAASVAWRLSCSASSRSSHESWSGPTAPTFTNSASVMAQRAWAAVAAVSSSASTSRSIPYARRDSSIRKHATRDPRCQPSGANGRPAAPVGRGRQDPGRGSRRRR